MALAARGMPVGDPPGPGNVCTLDELTGRLRDLRSWAQLTLRDIPERVEAMRRKRGIHQLREVRPSYGAVQGLFQSDRKAYRITLKQPMEEVRNPEFCLGPLQTPCRILEGEGERIIGERLVRVQVNPINVDLPPELAEWRAEIAAEQAHRRRIGENYMWNGPRYAVENLVISRFGLQEDPEVTLRLKNSDYYTFIATQLLDRQFRSGATPRSLYIDGRDPHEVPDFMRSSFGLNIALVTADEWLVVTRRSHQVSVGKNSWNSSANQGLNRHLDSRNGAPRRTCTGLLSEQSNKNFTSRQISTICACLPSLQSHHCPNGARSFSPASTRCRGENSSITPAVGSRTGGNIASLTM